MINEQTMHWARPRTQTMIEFEGGNMACSAATGTQDKPNIVQIHGMKNGKSYWESDADNSVYKSFREYKL